MQQIISKGLSERNFNLKVCFLLLFLGLGPFVSKAQKNIPEPDFINMPVFLFEGKKDLKNCAREAIKVGAGIGQTNAVLEGPTSTVKIQAASHYSIIIKGGDADPSSGLSLYKLAVIDSSRKATVASFNLVSAKGQLISYSLEKIQGKTFKITTVQSLDQGEYMFLNSTNNTCYTFCVE